MQPIFGEYACTGYGQPAGENPTITAVVTDSRAVHPGNLFVCIKGERVDGHDFAAATLEKGAVGIVAQHAVDGVPPEK